LPIAGGTGGEGDRVEPNVDETITRIVIYHDLFINAVTSETNTGRSVAFGDIRSTSALPNPARHQIDIGDGFEFIGLQGFSRPFRPNQRTSFAISALGCLVE
jgi:hypothetical protein